MARFWQMGICLLILTPICWAESEKPLLIRHPTVSHDNIAFCYAGDIWKVGRDGGDAARLTAGIGEKCDPHYSPDGTWVAYTADYYGNPDVFVIPATGGEPRRLTSHPAPDVAVGWSPDGKNVSTAAQSRPCEVRSMGSRETGRWRIGASLRTSKSNWIRRSRARATIRSWTKRSKSSSINSRRIHCPPTRGLSIPTTTRRYRSRSARTGVFSDLASSDTGIQTGV